MLPGDLKSISPREGERTSNETSIRQKSLKSKWIAVFEEFLNGQDPSENNENFWDELFLLKIHRKFLIQQLSSKTNAELVAKSAIWSKIFSNCMLYFDDLSHRFHNAFETFYLLASGLLHHRFNNWSQDVKLIFVGSSRGSEISFFSKLFEKLEVFLSLDSSDSSNIRLISINLITLLITSNNDFEDNFIVPILLRSNLAQILKQSIVVEKPGITRRDCAVLIFLLSLYLPNEESDSNNTEQQKVTIENPFLDLIRDYSSNTSIMKILQTHINEDFESAIISKGGVPQSELKAKDSTFFSVVSSWLSSASLMSIPPPIPIVFTPLFDTPTVGFKTDPTVSLLGFYLLCTENDLFLKSLFFPELAIINQHMNSTLHTNQAKTSAIFAETFANFLELAAFFVSSNDVKKTQLHSRIILNCIKLFVENTEISFLLHDDKLIGKIPLSAQQKKSKLSQFSFNTELPFVCYVVEVTYLYLRCHISDCFKESEPNLTDPNLLAVCLDILCRIICFQKKFKLKIQYPWKQLWTTLLILGNALIGRGDFAANYLILQRLLTTFNLFITFGDRIMKSEQYDDLYYEIIRCESQWRTITSKVIEYERNNSARSIDAATPTLIDCYNIRSILDHFTAKLGLFQASNPETRLVDEVVLQIIRANYETLQLQSYDHVDQFKPSDFHSHEDIQHLKAYARLIVRRFKIKRYMHIEKLISEDQTS